MAYDPTLPANNALIASAELRNQFAGLKTLIDATQAQVEGAATQDGLNDAIGDCAQGVNGVAPLALTISNPPTQAQVQAMLDKLNELIGGLHR